MVPVFVVVCTLVLYFSTNISYPVLELTSIVDSFSIRDLVSRVMITRVP